MSAVYYWPLLIVVVVNLGILLKLLECCKTKLPGDPGGGSGGPTPIPILGTVFNNSSGDPNNCSMGAGDVGLAGWEVRITPVAAAVPTHILTTSASGEFATNLDPGNYLVEAVKLAGSTLIDCNPASFPNPRNVTVVAGVSLKVNIPFKKANPSP